MRKFVVAAMMLAAACATPPAVDKDKNAGVENNPNALVENGAEASEEEQKRTAERQRAEAKIARVTSARLRKFVSESELRSYLDAVETVNKRIYGYYTLSDNDDTIIVTGSRITTADLAAPSITNNQVQGVDEGDIVKRIGDYFILLQDGRVFTIAIRNGDKPVIEPRDRIDVYESPDQDTWYDELLVHGDRIIVIGYSYDADATEVSILRLAGDGGLSFERRFFLSSDDYYSTENYAARMIGGRLVLHTPIWLGDLSFDQQQIQIPVVVPDRGGEDRFKMINGRPLFTATDIYRPVTELDDPMLHALSICDLELLGTEEFEGCETTAFIAEEEHEVFVGGSDIYVWSWRDGDHDGAADENATIDAAQPGMIHRVSLAGGPLAVTAAAGHPVNQFGMAMRDGKFYGLSRWWDPDSDRNDHPLQHFMLMSLPESRFGVSLGARIKSDYQPLPALRSAGDIENRFTDQYLLYGGSERRVIEELFEEGEDPIAGSPLIAVDLDHPALPIVLGLPHSVLRLDRAGPRDAVVTGYRGSSGLFVSYINMKNAPDVASTILIKDRFESESRSHAFNALIDESGGILGLPTVPNRYEAGRSVSRSETSDLTFITVDKRGILSHAGNILAQKEKAHADYKCEVSCIDWYGNSRPIFTDGRIFALSVTELVEVEREKDALRELRRIDLTEPQTFPEGDEGE